MVGGTDGDGDFDCHDFVVRDSYFGDLEIFWNFQNFLGGCFGSTSVLVLFSVSLCDSWESFRSLSFFFILVGKASSAFTSGFSFGTCLRHSHTLFSQSACFISLFPRLFSLSFHFHSRKATASLTHIVKQHDLSGGVRGSIYLAVSR